MDKQIKFGLEDMLKDMTLSINNNIRKEIGKTNRKLEHTESKIEEIQNQYAKRGKH
jgi:hypothetical protein